MKGNIAAVGAICLALALFLAPQVFATSDGYRIQVVGVSKTSENPPVANTDPSRERVNVHFEVSWEPGGFPGTRLCEWTVYGPQGEPIGRATSTLTSMESNEDEIYKQMYVEAGRKIGGSRVVCEPERLDDPSGRFEFSQIATRAPSSNLASDMDVMFTHAWHGDGMPTPQRCEIGIFDESGTLLFTSLRNFHSVGADSMSSNFSIEAPPEYKGENLSSTSAAIRCKPIQ